MYMKFWERVSIRIREQNTSQQWVASKIGVRPDSFSRWINRDVLPDAERATLIAKALGTTVEYLVSGEAPRAVD